MLQNSYIAKQPLIIEAVAEISSLNTVSLLELIDAAAGIYQLLSAREERVAFAANINLQSFRILGRSGLKRCAASADNRYLMILGMNARLHDQFTSQNTAMRTNSAALFGLIFLL